MSETIPADIKEIAETRVIPRGLDGNHYRSTLVYLVEQAIMEERKRCAALVRSRRPHREATAIAILRGDQPST